MVHLYIIVSVFINVAYNIVAARSFFTYVLVKM